jgi:hypothetical protein
VFGDDSAEFIGSRAEHQAVRTQFAKGNFADQQLF